MHAPTIAELLAHPLVQAALDQAWIDSLPLDAARRHEEGGWVYMNALTGTISIQRAPVGGQATLDISNPPIVAGSVVVATFHIYPNPRRKAGSRGQALRTRCRPISSECPA